jgi:outer membrane protein assembly factor BamE (lipoprotein component of BamABCDE complex)
MKNFLSALLLAFIVGCASVPPAGHIQPGRISQISVGMTKQEVINAIGVPESVAAGKDFETLYYVEERPWWQWVRIAVRLQNGKVTQFGPENP